MRWPARQGHFLFLDGRRIEGRLVLVTFRKKNCSRSSRRNRFPCSVSSQPLAARSVGVQQPAFLSVQETLLPCTGVLGTRSQLFAGALTHLVLLRERSAIEVHRKFGMRQVGPGP